ncbi:AGAP000915-PA-like protein [Anopheles sinensis]|uniref:AGAP000915-PA-like protein n=1 Tax=Anopheles sinensis TaxID=74873 RepID=A0A084VVB0_ANOSI|nr:AGAP000915-PA-like protein [Anopheles sinensis]
MRCENKPINDVVSSFGFFTFFSPDESLTCNVCDRAFRCRRQLASHQQKKRHFGYDQQTEFGFRTNTVPGLIRVGPTHPMSWPGDEPHQPGEGRWHHQPKHLRDLLQLREVYSWRSFPMPPRLNQIQLQRNVSSVRSCQAADCAGCTPFIYGLGSAPSRSHKNQSRQFPGSRSTGLRKGGEK